MTMRCAASLSVVLGAGLLVAVLAGAGCGGSARNPAASPAPADVVRGAPAALTVTSDAFGDGAPIPGKYTCDGQGLSPPLAWAFTGPPVSAGAFALIVDDPDAPAGVFTHWVVYNLPAGTAALSEGQPATEQLPGGGLQGRNGGGRTGYTGPCPPAGNVHHYRFTVYAVDRPLMLSAGATKDQLSRAMQGHILAQGLFTGTYQRQGR